MSEETEDPLKNRYLLNRLSSRKVKFLKVGVYKLLISSTNSFKEDQEQDWAGVVLTNSVHMLG